MRASGCFESEIALMPYQTGDDYLGMYIVFDIVYKKMLELLLMHALCEQQLLL